MKKIINPPAIEIEVVDRTGNIHLLKARVMTTSEIDEMGKMAERLNTGQVSTGSILEQQMAFIFGGKAEDYRIFDFRVIKAALNYFNEEISNPL